MTDPIIVCPSCGEYRHRSWFRAGERTCRLCQETNPEWLDSLARAVVRAEEATRTHQHEVKLEVKVLLAEPKPPEFTGSDWRLLQRIDHGATDEEIAAQKRVTVEVAETMRYELVEQAIKLAEKRLAIRKSLVGRDYCLPASRYNSSDQTALPALSEAPPTPDNS